MPKQVVTTADGTLEYWLACYDERGTERPEAAGARSDEIVERLRSTTAPITDVFFMSHGWKGDVPAAQEQYRAWLGAALACRADREAMRNLRPDFAPLVVGLHWPSLPMGDEEIPEDDSPAAVRAFVDRWSPALASDERSVAAMTTLVASAASHDAGDGAAMRAAADTLTAAVPLAGTAADDPWDGDAFEAKAVLEDETEGDARTRKRGGIASLFRQLSYWRMKDRARAFGETGAHDLLRRMQSAVDGRDVRFHAMGHSFGCVVASGMINGPDRAPALPRRGVDSAILVQGAVSLWAYASKIPVAPKKQGYFHAIVDDGKVHGPLVTTQSSFDSAVGKAYPAATRLHGSVSMGPNDPPKFGAIGKWGIRGIDASKLRSGRLVPATEDLGLRRGLVHNLDGDEFIRNGKGPSGAHSDIAHPEVAHAMWSAARA